MHNSCPNVLTTIIAYLAKVPDAVWAAIIASLLTTLGVLLMNRGNTKRLREQLSAENRRQRELNVKDKAEETFSTIQQVLEEAELIVREVIVFSSGTRWSSQQLQSTYWRLLKPINKLRLLLSLYFPKILKTESHSIAAAYNLVTHLRDYALPYTDISIGNQKLIPNVPLSDYTTFENNYSEQIAILNSFLDKFATEVSKILTTDQFT